VIDMQGMVVITGHDGHRLVAQRTVNPKQRIEVGDADQDARLLAYDAMDLVRVAEANR